MIEKRIEMAEVAECTIPECVYNRGSRCSARAITVGNGEHPECQTFYSGNHHAPKGGEHAGVGACTVAECRHNDGYNCDADRVYVGYQDNEVACLSFARP